MTLLMSIASLFIGASAIMAAPIPVETFAVMSFDPPLQDHYETGEAVLIAGEVLDPDKADGQFLLQFTPTDGDEPIQVFVALDGLFFRQYHIFAHDQAGEYEVDLFLGGSGESQLGYVNTFEGFTLAQGAGPVVLPVDYFFDIQLDKPLPTQFRTSQPITLHGESLNPAIADGQILFNFVDSDSGNDFPVFINLDGQVFRRVVFLGEEGLAAGAYELEIFIGGQGASSLAFVGRFQIDLIDDGRPLEIPVDYFTGLLLHEPLSIEWPVNRDLILSGSVAPGIQSLRFDLITKTRDLILTAPVEDARFELSVRLNNDELGGIELQVIRELADGQLLHSGSFNLLAVEAPLAPILSLGAVALAILPDGEQSLVLDNLGAAPLQISRFEFTGPFSVLETPGELAPGARAEAIIRYDGPGGEHGVLSVHSNDPQRPIQRVALHGLQSAEMPHAFRQSRADRDGFIELELDFARGDYALVLYSSEVAAAAPGVRYPYAFGGAPPAARWAPLSARGSWHQRQRLREALYADLLRDYRGPITKKAVALQQVGQQREFFYEEDEGSPRQIISATLVAVSEHALGWLQDDLRQHVDNVDVEAIAAMIDQFSDEDYNRLVAAFGRPSDVDADGRISFLFTHIVDDLQNVAGFYSSSSALPVASGGDGNRSDLLFISPTQPRASYRPLLAHEFQHLINFNEHVLERRGEAEVSWLNEGLSHLAEDYVAGFAASGQADNIAAFLRDPEAVSLEPEATDDARHRGAAYLFVRSLVDRMGEAIILRMVATGLADRANIEKATGESFADLLAAWGTQLYVSGLQLSDHPRFNFANPLLQAGAAGRGFPMPKEREYRIGGSGINGTLPQRGVVFVRATGTARERLQIASDPLGQLAIVAIPLKHDFASSAFVPADYVPGLRFSDLVPAVMAPGTKYIIRGEAIDDRVQELVLGFEGEESHDFFAEFTGSSFTVEIELPKAGEYSLNFFTGGEAAQTLDYAVGFAPIWVRHQDGPTAVAAEADALPEQFALGRVYPNPFNGNVVVELAVPDGAGEAVVEIFNALGQRVRRLQRGFMSPGQQKLHWDGRADGGRALASGVYFLQLKSPDYAAVRRMVFLQ